MWTMAYGSWLYHAWRRLPLLAYMLVILYGFFCLANIWAMDQVSAYYTYEHQFI